MNLMVHINITTDTNIKIQTFSKMMTLKLHVNITTDTDTKIQTFSKLKLFHKV